MLLCQHAVQDEGKSAISAPQVLLGEQAARRTALLAINPALNCDQIERSPLLRGGKVHHCVEAFASRGQHWEAQVFRGHWGGRPRALQQHVTLCKVSSCDPQADTAISFHLQHDFRCFC